jgi:tetratricopeptide (TPR) repeat protein
MDPKDVNLILTEANLQIKLENKDEFAKLMNEAIELDPKNPSLFFNLGVISGEQGDIEKAKEYYNKAIELDPDYADAYINLGSAMLEDDRALVEEMNQNLNNFDKYDEIKARQVDLYKDVIPLYEKALDIRPDDIDTIRTLMSLYENTGMDDKFQAMRKKYDAMK